MNEKKLFIFVFLLSLIGIITLYFLSLSLDYNEEFKPGEVIKIKGEIVSIFNSENFTVIDIMEPKSAKVIMFDNVTFYPGEKIEVIGKAEEYKNNEEIIASRIRILN